MSAAIGMREITPKRIRFRPDVRERLDAYLRRNPFANETDIFNRAVNKELSELEALEPKQGVAAA